MAIELNNRTKILAGVVVLAAAGAGAWLFFFQDDAPPPKIVVTSAAKSAPKDAPDAAKPAADAPKQVDAAPAAAKPAPKPAPGSPEQLVAEVIEASGIKTRFQAFSREALLKAGSSDPAKHPGTDPALLKAVTEMVGRVFEPAKMSAELAANLKNNLDAERMSRFLEILRQPLAMKMNSAEMQNAAPEAMQEYMESLRKSPPPAARVKLIQALDEVTRTSEAGTELATAMARDMTDAILAELQKAGTKVPKEARQIVGTKLNAMRGQMRSQIRDTLYVAYRNATDQELADYVKLLDTDTGRWGMEMLSAAIAPILVSRGSAMGKEIAVLALARRGGAMAKAPAEPETEPLAKAQSASAKPAEDAPAAPPEPVGYQRAANIRELYMRYNDVITATVMRDQAAVRQLLDDGKTPNVRQSDGMTPLMIAVGNGDAAIASMLLAKGADPNLHAMGGTSALSIARSRGAGGAELVQLLQRSGAKD